jgi:hypothetical protein
MATITPKSTILELEIEAVAADRHHDGALPGTMNWDNNQHPAKNTIAKGVKFVGQILATVSALN